MFRNRSIKNRKHNDDDGFTLIEVLIAIVIFAFGILAVASMQISSINGNADAQRVTDASTIAAKYLERLMALPNNDPELLETTVDGTAGLNNTLNPAADHQRPEGKYSVYWNIAPNIPATNNNTIRIIVTGTQGGQRPFSLDFIR